ncbi:hypothetical protein ACFXO9_26820 [Nocardia tengchongensis]|uniref:hypothetical protein n=1 Tax=Nocardia tengchongensis TaxID=2055889 RepID=UPI0036A82B65
MHNTVSPIATDPVTSRRMSELFPNPLSANMNAIGAVMNPRRNQLIGSKCTGAPVM